MKSLQTSPPPAHLRLHGTVGYHLANGVLIPGEPGVYLVHDLRGVLYVGRTWELRRRYREHLVAQTNRLLAAAMARPVYTLEFSWSQAGVLQQIALERELIAFFDPPCNRKLRLAGTNK